MSRFDKTFIKRLALRFNQLQVLNINGMLLTEKLLNEYFEIKGILENQPDSIFKGNSQLIDIE